MRVCVCEQETKKKYYEVKRKEQVGRERPALTGSLPVQPPSGPRFTGGGFSLTQQ